MGHRCNLGLDRPQARRSGTEYDIDLGRDAARGDGAQRQARGVAGIGSTERDEDAAQRWATLAAREGGGPVSGERRMQQGIRRAGQHPAMPREQAGIVGRASAQSLIEKKIRVVPTVGEIVDDENASRPAPAGRLEGDIARVVIDDQEISPACEPVGHAPRLVGRSDVERKDGIRQSAETRNDGHSLGADGVPAGPAAIAQRLRQRQATGDVPAAQRGGRIAAEHRTRAVAHADTLIDRFNPSHRS